MDAQKEFTIADRAIHRANEAEKKRKSIESLMKELRNYAMPSNEALGLGYSPTERTGKYAKMLYDNETQLAAIQHAGGVKSWMAPETTRIFDIRPPDAIKSVTKVAAWCNKLTDRIHRDLAEFGFHAADHSAILDGAVFGHRNVRVHEQPDSSVLFRHVECGSYSFLENEAGNVDSIFSFVRMSAREAEQKFGLENLPEEVQKKLTKETAAKQGNDEDEYLYACMPRLDTERDAGMPFLRHNMPFAILWIHTKSKEIVSESGSWYPEDHISRYLKIGRALYGTGAAEMALIASRCGNELSRDLDLLIKKRVAPPMLVPQETSADDVNVRPGAINFYRDPNRVPKPMLEMGSTQEGEIRLQQRNRNIRQAFFLDIFQALSNKTKEMSATEASLLSEEQIRMFSPTFALMAREHYQAIILHVVIIRIMQSQMAHVTGDVSRQWFDPVPQEMLTKDGALAPLQVAFVSKMALALQAVHAGAFERSMALRMEVAQVIGPEAFDDLDLNQALSDIDRSRGLPEDWRRSPEEVAALKQQRIEQQQMREQAEAAGKVAPLVQATKPGA